MMYRNPKRVHMNTGDLRLQRRVLLAVCAVLLCVAVVLGALVARNGVFRKQTLLQLNQRMSNAVSSAVEEVNRMSGIATSNTSVRLARVRQYVYFMNQLNELSMSLRGGEGGRMAPSALMESLFDDLDAFEAQTQAATSSTMDTRTQLLNHLTEMQNVLISP